MFSKRTNISYNSCRTTEFDKLENVYLEAARIATGCKSYTSHTLREESSQTNVILQYKLLASLLSAVCSVIQQL